MNMVNKSDNDAYILPCNFATLYFTHKDEFRINTTVVAIINISVAIPTIFLNILVLTAMYKKASLRKCNNKILTSLSTADLLSGLLVQPTIASILLIANIQDPLAIPCGMLIFIGCTGYTLACISLLTVSFVSFERYLAVFHPYVYNRRISSRFLFVVCSCIWICSCAIVFSMYLTEQHNAFFWMNAVVITLTYVWNIYVYIQIMRQVRTIQREFQQRRERLGTVKTDVRQSKGMKLAAAVIFILLTCYLPQVILSIWRSVPNYHLFVDEFLEYWSMTIGLLPSCLNPWVYCYYNSEIKKEVIVILCSVINTRTTSTENIPATLRRSSNNMTTTQTGYS